MPETAAGEGFFRSDRQGCAMIGEFLFLPGYTVFRINGDSVTHSLLIPSPSPFIASQSSDRCQPSRSAPSRIITPDIRQGPIYRAYHAQGIVVPPLVSHLRLVFGFCRAVDTPPFRTKAEHRVPLLLLVLPGRLCCKRFTQETLDRVLAAGTGPVFQCLALLAGRHLARQQRGKVVLPERSVDLSRSEETLDMPCRVLHAGSMGGTGIYRMRRRKGVGRTDIIPGISIIHRLRVAGFFPATCNRYDPEGTSISNRARNGSYIPSIFV
jgi:hypothetical protein